MALWLKHAAEVWAGMPDPGPTGDYAEVTAGEVRDEGGNVLFSGTADDCVREKRRLGRLAIKARLVPTEWRNVGDDAI